MTIAIGDIHGCLEALQALVKQLPEQEPLVFLGDYIDRGPQSAGVIAYLRQLGAQRPCRFLRGNHEQLMLDAIDGTPAISAWLYNGGTTTLRSYGEDAQRWARQQQRGAFLERDRDWLEALEWYVEDESTIYVHAGIDLGIRDMASQDRDVLLWIRDPFFKQAHLWHGKQIVFGHTPTLSMGLKLKAVFQGGALWGIDTGCVYGGFLTALDVTTHQLYQQRGLSPTR